MGWRGRRVGRETVREGNGLGEGNGFVEGDGLGKGDGFGEGDEFRKEGREGKGGEGGEERGGEGKGWEGKARERNERKAEDKIWLRLCECAQTDRYADTQAHKSENSISACFTPFTWRI